MTDNKNGKKVVAKFLAWVSKQGGRSFLYRGIAGKDRKILSSIVRRLLDKDEFSEEEFTEAKKEFVSANQELIRNARMRGHDKPKDLKTDLDILAELQHYGAATCLIDFTRNPLVGLWFACQNSTQHPTGKVFAIDSGEYDHFIKINQDMMEMKIQDLLLSTEKRKSKLLVWEPIQQNERITAQQSVFVFGEAEIKQAEYIKAFEVENTAGVLHELQRYGISAESLFCDFDGFVRLNKSNKKNQSEDYFDKARDEHAHEEYKLAIDYYDRALKCDSTNNKFYYHRGRAKASLRLFQEAIEDYNQAPIDYKMHLHRGNARAYVGDCKSAIKDYNSAININSQHADAYNSRGNAKGELGEYKGAIEDFTTAININPQHASTYNNRGNAKTNLGDNKGAIEDYNIAIKNNPQHANAYSNRGNAKTNLGDNKGAIEDYNIAIKNNPQHANAYYNRGVVRWELDNRKGAIEDFSNAININPQDAGAYYNRGIAKEKLDDHKGAIEDYSSAININPQFASAYYNRGVAKGRLGGYKGAIEDYNIAIKNNPQHAKAYYNRGVAKWKSDNKKDALADFRKANELNPEIEIPPEALSFDDGSGK